jgi:hypothetical protein
VGGVVVPDPDPGAGGIQVLASISRRALCSRGCFWNCSGLISVIAWKWSWLFRHLRVYGHRLYPAQATAPGRTSVQDVEHVSVDMTAMRALYDTSWRSRNRIACLS